jgi:EAL domain-containing protein (putative c-di-GMP-specific phosphodiesterase class I)/PAS domain-containing protein
MKNILQRIYRYFKETIVLYGWFSFMLIPIIIIINFSFFSIVSSQKESVIFRETSVASQDIKTMGYHISQLISTAHNDMHVIKDADETDHYLTSKSNEDFDGFESLLYRIMSNKPEFISISLVNLDGDELMNVTRESGTLIKSDDLDSINLTDFVSDASSENIDHCYLRKIELIDGEPIFYITAPLLVDNVIDSYIVMSYDANHFLSIFDVFVSDSEKYYSVGLINEDNVWLVGMESQEFELVTNVEQKADILLNVEEDENTLQSIIELNPSIYDHSSIDAHFFLIYATIDADAAIQSSDNFILTNTWIIYVIDFILVAIFIVIGYIIKKRNDDKMMLNANMYLSDKNIDGVLIADEKFHTEYVNEAFTDFFGYTMNDLNNQIHYQLLNTIDTLDQNQNQKINHAFEGHVWNQTKEGLFYLKYLRVKKEMSSRQKVKHYINIFSQPIIDFNDQDLKSLVDMMMPLFKTFGFIENESVLISLTINNVDVHDFALFINMYAKHDCKIIILNDQHVFLYGQLDGQTLEERMYEVDQMIELYRHQPDVSSLFTHFYLAVKANHQTFSMRKMIEASIIGLKASRSDKQSLRRVFNVDMITKTEKETAIREALKSAFENEDFFMNYQFIKDTKNDRFIGVEALLRWRHIEYGLISPVDFIPVIEDSHYINELTIMVVKNVIRDFTPYIDVLPDDFTISINITNFDLVNDYILDELIHLIESSPIHNERIIFEITESYYINKIENTNQIIKKLHQKNIRIGIDDYGTGYSSISFLKDIDVDYVKIDRVFMMNYPEGDDGSMFYTITSLVQNLNKPIIVEGIETEQQLEFSNRLNCFMIQGYYISKPDNVEDIVKRLKQ